MAKKDEYLNGEGLDRASYGGSVYDQQYFTDDELRKAAQVRAAAEAGTTSWDDAHRYVEDIRKQYGYSGDTSGGSYLPFQQRSGEGFSGQNGGGFSYESAPQYISKYQDQINSLSQQILGRQPFSYDYASDPNYQQYAESYTRNGQRAMQDTLGQVSARTGGLASSYAGSAAQQTYDNYMSALADKVPELRQLAYSMYQDEGDRQMDYLSMLQALENSDYARYADSLNQYNTDRNFNYGAWRDTVSDSRYADETEYNRNLDQAQLMASAGDFSGYKALGLTDEQINNLRSAYQQSLYSSASSGGSARSSGSSGSSGSYGAEQDYEGLWMAAENSGNPQSFIANNYKRFGFTSSSGLYSDYKNWLENKEDGLSDRAQQLLNSYNNKQNSMDPEVRQDLKKEIEDAWKSGEISDYELNAMLTQLGY